jgi:hypothetical protein
MGFFSWVWGILKSTFTSDEVRVHELETDIALDKQELMLDKKRRNVEKFENEDFRVLTENAYAIFEAINQTKQVSAYQGKIISLIRKIQEIKTSSGIKVEFIHLKELYSDIWISLKPLLERDFGNIKVIADAIKEIEARIRNLAKEINQEDELLQIIENVEIQKQAFDKKEE